MAVLFSVFRCGLSHRRSGYERSDSKRSKEKSARQNGVACVIDNYEFVRKK